MDAVAEGGAAALGVPSPAPGDVEVGGRSEPQGLTKGDEGPAERSVWIRRRSERLPITPGVDVTRASRDFDASQLERQVPEVWSGASVYWSASWRIRIGLPRIRRPGGDVSSSRILRLLECPQGLFRSLFRGLVTSQIGAGRPSTEARKGPISMTEAHRRRCSASSETVRIAHIPTVARFLKTE